MGARDCSASGRGVRVTFAPSRRRQPKWAGRNFEPVAQLRGGGLICIQLNCPLEINQARHKVWQDQWDKQDGRAGELDRRPGGGCSRDF